MNLKINELFYKTFNREIENIEKINAHGSSRLYFRCNSGDISCLAAINSDKKENIAFLDYSRQLLLKRINVPKVYGEDLENNIYLLQDLGNTTLYDLIIKRQNNEISNKEIKDIYYKVIKSLIKIQIKGGENFDYSNAYPREAFDKLSINWDLNYFKYYFLKLSGIIFDEQALENDFEKLSNYLLSTNTNFFLFRDFQSRNIMILDNEPWFIDYQGGRKGALQYDLASLLFDAKADLSVEFREELLALYIDELSNHFEIEKKEFKEYFYAYVYIRILQALGAYGYRGYFERKEHFLKSIPYAIDNIKWLRENIKLPIDIPELYKVLDQLTKSEKIKGIAKQKLIVNIKSFSYKKGYPQDISGNGGGFIFDCRAIHNPGRYDQYKKLTGKDQEVITFLEKEEDVNLFFKNVSSLVLQSVNKYLERNFTNLSVYFGCTGGQHRSVYFAERLAKILSQNPDIDIVLQHVEQNK